MTKPDDQSRMDKIVSLAKRRGFIFPSSEIYGGLNGFWDYGPLGVVLVSVILGLALGWLTHYSFLALWGLRPEYFIIAFPAAIWACFVESWLVSSYLGEFLIFVFVLFIFRALLNCYIFLKKQENINIS